MILLLSLLRWLHIRGVLQQLWVQRFSGNQWIYLGTSQLLGKTHHGSGSAYW